MKYPSLTHSPAGGPVTADALRRAIARLDFLEAHERCIFAPALFGTLTTARLIARHIKKGNLPKVFQAKHFYDKGWEEDEVLKGWDVLKSHG